MDKKYYIKHIVNHDSIMDNFSISIRNGRISGFKKERPANKNDAFYYAVPGFIDMHTHGGNGKELMDNSPDALDEISRFYLQNGTTSFLASTVTSGLNTTKSVLKTASEFMQANGEKAGKGNQAKLLGIHLEGPWLSHKNLGAQNPAHCIVPDKESLDLVEKYHDAIKMVTFSYHTRESEKLLQLLVEKNIIPACGHDETYDERMLEGLRKGFKVVTHI